MIPRKAWNILQEIERFNAKIDRKGGTV